MEIYDKESYREVALETLADKEHEQWRSWINYCIENYDLPDSLVQKWKANDRPYNELPEEEKEKDRKWARKVLESDKIKVAKFSCMFCSRRFDRDELSEIAPVGFSNNDYTVDDLSPEIQKEIKEADKDPSEILYVWKCTNCAENHEEERAIRSY